MNKIHLDIKDSIADTLFITLNAKAHETAQKNPLISDVTACELINKIDYDFSRFKNKKASSVGVAIRASHFDNVARSFIKSHGKPIVVIVGCGLDTRLQRLGSIASKAIFYQLDIDETINLRKQLIEPQDNEILIASSMLETDWMDEIATKHPHGNFLFIIEGVLMYFNENDNKTVFTALAQRFAGAEIHFDILNTFMSKRSSMHDTVSKTNATFKFGIDDDKEIEKWHPKLKYLETYLFKDLNGYQRMGFVLSSLMKIIPAFRTSSRILSYKIIL
jgi:O-methyltransferase involved in polyketide biosynthesis